MDLGVKTSSFISQIQLIILGCIIIVEFEDKIVQTMSCEKLLQLMFLSVGYKNAASQFHDYLLALEMSNVLLFLVTLVYFLVGEMLFMILW